MTDGVYQIDVVATADGVETGVRQAKQSFKSLSDEAARAGEKVEKGLGSGADGASASVERATKSIINSIQRTTAATEAGARGTSAYYEAIAKQRGVSVDSLKPYLSQLDAATEKQRAASMEIRQTSLSAKEMAFALRGVPAQFTDIATSIAGGQKPLTVLLQQGGQLKDMFGGIGPAARALGGYVVGLINPFTLAAGAATALGYAYYQGSEEAKNYAKAIILTGNAAGVTVDKLNSLATSVAGTTGATKGAAAEALQQAVASGRVAAGNLELVSSAALKMEKATGQSVSDTIKQFEELGKSPVEASLKLNESQRYLTSEIYRQIKALEDQGKAADAAALAQKTFADAMNGRSDQLIDNLSAIESLWKGIAGAAKHAADAIMDVGRATPRAERIAELEQMNSPGRGIFSGRSKAQDEELAYLKKAQEAEDKKAKSEAEVNKQREAGIQWLREGEQFLSKQVKLQQDIEKARNLGIQAGLTEEQIQKRIGEIRAKYQEKSSGKSQAVKDAEELEAVLNKINAKSAGFDNDYLSSLATLQKAYQGNKITLDDYRSSVIKLNSEQKFSKDIAKELAEQEKARGDFFSKLAADEQRRAASIEQQNASLEDEISMFGLSKEAQAEYRAAKLEDAAASDRITAATLESQAVMLNMMGILPEVAQGYLDLAEAKRQAADGGERQATLVREREQKASNKRVQDEAEKEWKRGWEETDRIARQVFDAWGENGADAAQQIGRTLRSALRSAIYEATLKPIVFQVYGQVTNAFGMSGAAGGGGVGGLGGLGGAGGYNPLSGSFSTGNTGFAGLWSSAPVNSWTNFGFSGVGKSLGLSTTVGEGVKQLTSAGEWLSANGASALGYAGALYSLSQGNYGSAAGAAIGTYIMPGIGTAIGSVLGGLLDGGGEDPHNNADSTGYAFKLTKSGVMGTGTGAGITDEVPANIPYSWVAGQTSGRGRWNDGTALTSAQITQIVQASAAVFASGESIAKTLGLSPSLLNSTTVASTGFKSIEDALSQLGDEIATRLIPNIKDFQASGETLGTTLSRLAGEFVLTDQMAAIMGRSGNAAFGASGIGGRDNLIQLLGGASSATAAFDTFWQNFYSEGERKDYTKGQIGNTLKAVGLDVIPTTRDEFRKLVEAQDLATESGRKMYATLLAVSGSFAGITDAAAMGGAYGTRDLKTSSFANRTDYLRAQRATGKAEAVIVSDPKVMNELAQLRAQFRNLEASQVSMARFALKSAQVLEKWEGIGMPVERAAL
jgi:phage-related minor tail protein